MEAGRGHLIVFEGLDKSGKTTQCARLVEALRNQGRKVKHIRFPNRQTMTGKIIDAYLKGDSGLEDHANPGNLATLMTASAEIEQDIKNGVDVVLDRYYYSGCVYSAAKENPALDMRWARQPEEGLPQPDICLFLDVSTDDAAGRGDFGDERYEQKDMQNRVRSLFKQAASSRDGEPFVVIDAGRPIEEVHEAILEAVDKGKSEVVKENRPLGRVRPPLR